MPPPFIPKKVEDIIYYYYAKLVIAPSAGLKGNYGFIIDTYKRLKTGKALISDYERELLHITEKENTCAFCGANSAPFRPVHIVPRLLGVPPGMQNLVIACEACANSKGEKDLVEWWCMDLKKTRDELPRVAVGLYLKIAYELHKINFTLRKNCQSIEKIFAVLK